jgi:hypothetical protein
MGCTGIDYCIYDIHGLWLVFVVMCLWICVWMCLWACIYGFGFVWASGLDPSRGLVQQILGLTSPWGLLSSLLGITPPRGPFQQFLGLTPPRGPFQQIFGTYSFTRPISAIFGTYSSTRPISANLWDLLLHEAHFSKSLNFSNFPLSKMEKFAPVCSVE